MKLHNLKHNNNSIKTSLRMSSQWLMSIKISGMLTTTITNTSMLTTRMTLRTTTIMLMLEHAISHFVINLQARVSTLVSSTLSTISSCQLAGLRESGQRANKPSSRRSYTICSLKLNEWLILYNFFLLLKLYSLVINEQTIKITI